MDTIAEPIGARAVPEAGGGDDARVLSYQGRVRVLGLAWWSLVGGVIAYGLVIVCAATMAIREPCMGGGTGYLLSERRVLEEAAGITAMMLVVPLLGVLCAVIGLCRRREAAQHGWLAVGMHAGAMLAVIISAIELRALPADGMTMNAWQRLRQMDATPVMRTQTPPTVEEKPPAVQVARPAVHGR